MIYRIDVRRCSPRVTSLLASFLISACGSTATTGIQVRQTAVTVPSPLLLILQSPEYVSLGTAVPLRLVLKNLGDQKITIGLPGIESQRADFVVSSGGKEIWSKLHGATMMDVSLVKPLGPGDSTVFDAVWAQRDNRGNRVGPGTYMIQGVVGETLFSHSPNGVASPAIQVVVH